MKTIKFLAIAMVLFFTSTIQSQVSVNVNIGTPPAWGPAGYSQVDYYYLPDIQMYYDIPAAQFIYFGNGKWYRSRYLPARYKNYNLYNGYKVVLNNYHGKTPYTYFKQHKVKYYKGYKGKPQKTIGHQKNYSKSKNNNSVHNKKSQNKGNGNKKH